MHTLPPDPPDAPTTRSLRRPAWADLADLSPAYFAMVMATGIVSLAADLQGCCSISTLPHGSCCGC
jgi:hypothetical protein